MGGYVIKGKENKVTDDWGTVGGGYNNQAGSDDGTTTNASYATVGGGVGNTASGYYATVPGGRSNTAQGVYSFAVGQYAKAMHDGCFVWGDASSEDFITSSRDNQFIIRAAGGIFAKTSSPWYGLRIDNHAGSGNGIEVDANVSCTGYFCAALWAHNDGTSPTIVASNWSSSGHAAHFIGDITVTGRVNEGSGAFKIDHPLDPANKYLNHSSVQSNDMMSIYNGNVTLDSNGEAIVELPEWFEALNKDFRYQLTAVGMPAPNLHVADEISGNRFRISGGDSAMKVSWLVTGIRKDAYANKHCLEVEVEKVGDERGRYLHPEEHGVPETMGIDYEAKQKKER